MFYRDFMQKYRPLYAPDGPAAGGADGAAAAAADAGQAAAAAPAPADSGMTAGEGGAAAVPAAADAAPAPALAEAPAPSEPAKSEPSLLEAASGKKPGEAAAADGDKKDSPAPAEAAKVDGDAKVEGDKKPDAEAAAADKKDAKPEEAKDPKDAAKADPDKKDATAEAQPPAPIKYEAFKLPDGVKLDDERIGKFTEVTGAAQVPQEVAQKLVDLHVEEMQRFAGEVKQQAETHQRDVWNKLNDTWKTDLRKDEKLGGNRIETTLSLAKAVLEEYGGSPEQVQELIAHTSNNGMGNFPGFIRLLANIGEALNVFEESSVGANLNPPKPAKGSGQRGWYKDMPGGPQA
jgi:hypothetical protein